MTLDVVRSMPTEEFLGWVEYLLWKSENERKAFKNAQKDAKRRRR